MMNGQGNAIQGAPALAVRQRVLHPKVIYLDDRPTVVQDWFAHLRGRERKIDRFGQHIEEIGYLDRAFVRLVDDTMNLIERGHDAQEQDREGENEAETDAAVRGQVEGQAQDRNVPETFVQCLGTTKQRHLKMMARLLDAALLRCAGHTLNLVMVSIGGANVFDAAQLLDDGAVHHLAAAAQGQAHAFLRNQLPDGEYQRKRNDSGHHQADVRLLDGGRYQSKPAHEDRGKEIQKRQAQKTDEAYKTSLDAAVKRSDALLRQGRQV